MEARQGGGTPRWDPLLLFLCESSGAARVLVMDPAGLLIAASPAFEVSEAEPLGARLMAALDHVKALGGDPVLCLALDERYVSAFDVRTRDGLNLTIGLLSEVPLDVAVCRAIRAALEA